MFPLFGSRTALIWLLAFMPFLGCRCLFKEELPPPPPPLSRYDVLKALRESQERLTAFVSPSTSVHVEHRREGSWSADVTFGGIIAFDRGGEGRSGPFLYVRGEKVGVELFTLKVRGDRFGLRLPDSKECVQGTEKALDKLPEMIRAEDVAILTAPPDALGLDSETCTFRWTGEDYVFDVHDGYGRLRRRVRVDRREMVMKSIVEYAPSGAQATSLLLRDHGPPTEPAGWAGRVPRRFIVKRPAYGLRLTVWLNELKMKGTIPAQFFEFKCPPGWTPIDLDVESVGKVKGLGGGG